jgi:hypothetical protein
LKRVTFAICLVFLLSNVGRAQFSGQLSTPKTVTNGASTVGLYAGVFDDAIGLLGQYRYGIGGYTDLGFKLGVLDLDFQGSDAAADLAFDVKYQVMEMRMRDPFELSIDGGVDFLFAEDLTVLSLGFGPIGSYPVKLKSGRVLEPYGRLQVRVERTDLDRGGDDTDFEIGLNIGTAFELSGATRAIGELQFDDQFGFFFGVDFEL